MDNKYLNISEYDIEIERKKKELNELYRNEGEARYSARQGGVIALVMLMVISIIAICTEEGRLYGIIGLILCVLGVIAVVFGVKYRNNKIERLELEIAELEARKRRDEKKYCNIGNPN